MRRGIRNVDVAEHGGQGQQGRARSSRKDKRASQVQAVTASAGGGHLVGGCSGVAG